MKYIFVDTETTGFSIYDDHLLEVAAIKTDENFVVMDKMDSYCKLPANAAISNEVKALTGICEEDCKRGDTIEKVYTDFLKIIEPVEKTILVAHNAHFDVSFLMATAERYFLEDVFEKDYIHFLDTLTISRDRRKIGPHKLRDMLLYYNLGARNTHCAYDDAMTLVDLLKAMKEEKNDLADYIDVFGFRRKYGKPKNSIKFVNYIAQ